MSSPYPHVSLEVIAGPFSASRFVGGDWWTNLPSKPLASFDAILDLFFVESPRVISETIFRLDPLENAGKKARSSC